MQRISFTGIPMDGEATLFCGQTFSWRRAGHGVYEAVIDHRPIRLIQDDLDFSIAPCAPEDEAFWATYFDLGRDYEALLSNHMGDPILRNCTRKTPGLRVLNQPVWETIFSFILSANNHEKRIAGLVARLSNELGDTVYLGDKPLGALPTPLQLYEAGETRLRALGTGYRAKYLVGTAQRVLEGFDLEGLHALDYDEALKALCTLPGVGEKVADCILLFSLGKGRAFPVDVWMERVLTRCYGMKGTRHALRKQAYERFGEEAGILQQYIFNAARNGDLDEYFKGVGV